MTVHPFWVDAVGIIALFVCAFLLGKYHRDRIGYSIWPAITKDQCGTIEMPLMSLPCLMTHALLTMLEIASATVATLSPLNLTFLCWAVLVAHWLLERHRPQ
jgi:hypothetical protein